MAAVDFRGGRGTRWEEEPIFDGPTRRQRHALYRFGVSRRRVAMLNRRQASALLEVLIGSIPRPTYDRLHAPAGKWQARSPAPASRN